jgi:hypothetical protein
MANRTGNYSAFYVKEPFNATNLGCNATRDFVFYNLLRAWKEEDSSFPFVHNAIELLVWELKKRIIFLDLFNRSCSLGFKVLFQSLPSRTL